MGWVDALNGLLELTGGLFILLSIRKLHTDKKVRGVSWVQVSFFMFWGFWNLFYYPHLDQWMSLLGAIVLVSTDTIWVGMFFYYSRMERLEKAQAEVTERLSRYTRRAGS